jgi:hypothetical protein
MTNLDFISDRIDDLYDAILDAINQSYNYMPTNLNPVLLSADENNEQYYYDALTRYTSGNAGQ